MKRIGEVQIYTRCAILETRQSTSLPFAATVRGDHPKKVADVEDLQKLKAYTNDQIARCMKSLEKKFVEADWITMRNCLAIQIETFNVKRPAEVALIKQ